MEAARRELLTPVIEGMWVELQVIKWIITTLKKVKVNKRKLTQGNYREFIRVILINNNIFHLINEMTLIKIKYNFKCF